MRSPATKHSFLEFVTDRDEPRKTVPLLGELVRLGRDYQLEIQIDASAAMVSRRHAEIRLVKGRFQLADLNSYNGTFLNGQRIVSPVELNDGDRLELGLGGPILYFRTSTSTTPKNRTLNSGTHEVVTTKPHLLRQHPFSGQQQLTIGRAKSCDICLDGLLISNRHALITEQRGKVFVEDISSTNGTYLNGKRLYKREQLAEEDIVQIGPFFLQANSVSGVRIFDTRAQTRIDVVGVTQSVRHRSGSGTIQLLDDIRLTIRPNEFVGLLGPSGAGKSTLMDALNGRRPALVGQVLFNSIDLYRHLDFLKQQIGYVPQEDIIYRELTVRRTLYYVAKLRLSHDVNAQEINQIVAEVMDLTDLSERADIAVSQLSGGQRKRVSIAVELMTKPSVLFLDEPTSGLDPATEEKIMLLFRQIAESGRTVILTTHAMENISLFDKIVVLMRGKLVFYGTPQESLAYIDAENFKNIYDKLEAPIAERLSKMQQLRATTKEMVAEAVAEEWKDRFKRTEAYRCNVSEPDVDRDVSVEGTPTRKPLGLVGAARQWATLTRRYAEVLGCDKPNLLILFSQALIIALLTYLGVGKRSTRDFLYFVLALSAIWFGASLSAREIIRERAIYNRERMINLKLVPYVASKLFVLCVVVGVQCILLFGPLKFLDHIGVMEVPGSIGGLSQFSLMVLTGMVGVALGLLISAIVKTSETATSLVPLVLIPQILFSGIVGVPQGASKMVGLAMPTTWSFDGMKRLSGLHVLRGSDEGADSSGTVEGRGLYKQIEFYNEEKIKETGQKIEQYKAEAEKKSEEFDIKMQAYLDDVANSRSVEKPVASKLGPPPSAGEARKIPDDLSGYVEFLHPYGSVKLNTLLLLAMFCGLAVASVLALRIQDVR